MRTFTDLQGHSFDDFDPCILHPGDFTGVVGHQPHLRKAQGFQELRTDTEVPFVILEPQSVVSLDRVKSLILQ